MQERAHIAEFFVGDDWKVSDRLTLNLGTRYTLNFPSTEVNNQGAVFNLNTQVLDFPHTARDLECCDFGPRAGLAYRLNDSTSRALRLRHGLVRTNRHYDAVHAAAVSVRADGGAAIAGQYQRGVCAGQWATRAGDGSESELRPGAGSFRRATERWIGLLAAVEFHDSEDIRTKPEFRGWVSGLKEHAPGIAGGQSESVARSGSGVGAGAADESGESVLRADSDVVVAWERRRSPNSSCCGRIPGSRTWLCFATT